MSVKHSRRILFFSVIIGTLSIIACVKYSDKLLFNWKSKPEQLARNWIIEKATINGRDVTSDYERFILSLTERGDAGLFAKFQSKKIKFEYKTIGKWFLMNNQNKILLDFENNEADVVYHILSIKNNEIRLKKDDESLELNFISE